MLSADREARITSEEIDARAKELFKECGGLDMEWGAVDECVRTHYRGMAAGELDRPCETCNDDPEECAKVPGARHCEKANRSR